MRIMRSQGGRVYWRGRELRWRDLGRGIALFVAGATQKVNPVNNL
jgi:hypothetical protein